jgi:hypothetical protein
MVPNLLGSIANKFVKQNLNSKSILIGPGMI